MLQDCSSPIWCRGVPRQRYVFSSSLPLSAFLLLPPAALARESMSASLFGKNGRGIDLGPDLKALTVGGMICVSFGKKKLRAADSVYMAILVGDDITITVRARMPTSGRHSFE